MAKLLPPVDDIDRSMSIFIEESKERDEESEDGGD